MNSDIAGVGDGGRLGFHDDSAAFVPRCNGIVARQPPVRLREPGTARTRVCEGTSRGGTGRIWLSAPDVSNTMKRSGTPVLGFTRRGDQETKLRAFDLGIDDILTMPFLAR